MLYAIFEKQFHRNDTLTLDAERRMDRHCIRHKTILLKVKTIELGHFFILIFFSVAFAFFEIWSSE